MATAMESPIAIPGAFLPDHNTSFDRCAWGANMFLPPPDSVRSPSSSYAASTARSSAHAQSRKRPRLSTRARPDTGYLRSPPDNYSSTSHSCSLDAPSPAPLVPTDYKIAGGIDASSTALFQLDEQDREYEIDCRQNRFAQTAPSGSRPPPGTQLPQTPDSLPDSRARKRRLSNSPTGGGWSKTIWALTGGAAGKVLNFCWSHAFGGFHAGGGRGYHMDSGPALQASSVWMDVDGKDDVFNEAYEPQKRRVRGGTPVPGGFPEEPDLHVEEYRARPRQANDHLATPTANLHSGWVVVESGAASRESSPVRKKPRASTASLHARPTSTTTTTNHPRPKAQPRLSASKSGASYASPRSSFGPGEIAAGSKKPSPPGPTGRQSYIPSPSPHRRSQSMAGVKQSPEVKKFEKKMRRREAREDERLSSMSAQLQALIREGQQALGSMVEVYDEDDDNEEGYAVSGMGVRRNLT